MGDCENSVLLQVQDLTKVFGGTVALHDATIAFQKGVVHALCGENGAGKSTLCKMLSGAIVPTSGMMIMNGETHTAFTPKDAKACGIGMIYQEFNLVPELSIYENIFLGKELRRGVDIDRKRMIQETEELFSEMNIQIDPQKKICDISVAYCQLVEIAKALKEDVKLLIMDEPTAPLTNQEVGILFGLVKQLRERGITVIYISHRMEEIFELSDYLTVMRDGAVVKTMRTCDTNQQEIISLMVGRELGMEFPPKGAVQAEETPALEVKHLTTDVISDVSFKVHHGEILGLAGLVGAGRTETIRAIFGADRLASGEIWVNGKAVKISSPSQAIKLGIGMIPEDRKRQGVHLELPIRSNMSLILIQKISKLMTINRRKEQSLIDRYINKLSIKLSSPELPVSSLSGGNQQKIVLTKWLATEPDIFFFDEPTRGIDVGAKHEIYILMDQLRKSGKAIVMISSEMPEVIGMCDRVVVMYEGKVMKELSGSDINQEKIMTHASGLL